MARRAHGGEDPHRHGQGGLAHHRRREARRPHHAESRRRGPARRGRQRPGGRAEPLRQGRRGGAAGTSGRRRGGQGGGRRAAVDAQGPDPPELRGLVVRDRRARRRRQRRRPLLGRAEPEAHVQGGEEGAAPPRFAGVGAVRGRPGEGAPAPRRRADGRDDRAVLPEPARAAGHEHRLGPPRARRRPAPRGDDRALRGHRLLGRGAAEPGRAQRAPRVHVRAERRLLDLGRGEPRGRRRRVERLLLLAGRARVRAPAQPRRRRRVRGAARRGAAPVRRVAAAAAAAERAADAARRVRRRRGPALRAEDVLRRALPVGPRRAQLLVRRRVVLRAPAPRRRGLRALHAAGGVHHAPGRGGLQPLVLRGRDDERRRHPLVLRARADDGGLLLRRLRRRRRDPAVHRRQGDARRPRAHVRDRQGHGFAVIAGDVRSTRSSRRSAPSTSP